MPSDPQKALAKLLEREAEVLDQLAAIHAEMSALVNGEDGIAVKLKRLEAFYSETWATRYRSLYIFNFAADRAQWKRLLKTMTVEELEARIVLFITSDDRFYLQTRHAFNVFVKVINSLIPVPRSVGKAFGCQCDPPCLDDAEHTRRRGNGARA